jgi:hypothetical protein
MATSTLRALILAGLVIVGLLGLTKLFPSNASIGVTPTPSHASITPTTVNPSGSPTGTPSPTAKPRKNSKVTVLVLNATPRTGLAAGYTDQLKGDGYKTKTPADYPGEDQDVTIIYYQPGFQPEAQKLKDKFFRTGTLQQAPSSVPVDVDIEVVLGADAAG